jgi:TP901 family phage tail tape measure protein
MATAPVTVNANLNFNPASVRAAGNQVQSAFGNINLPSRAVNNFNNSLGRITGQASEFDKSINAATARVFAFGAAVSIINGISTAFKALISSTIEVEKRITEIGSIIGGTAEQLGQFKTAIFDVAKNTGQTFDTVANGAAELARQGLSAEETVKRLNSALILTRVSGLDAESSVSALTAAINGFTSAGLTAEQIVNKLIAVDTAFAVSAKDLAEAFSRAGSTAEDAGVSFDQLLGLVTSVQQTTARGGAVIGNAFKSIFARLGRGTVIEDLKALGVEIDQSQNGVQKLQALATALANISDPTKANAIKELAGGVYQINIVSAALKDLSSETSVFGKASEIAGQASNEAFEKNAQLNQTLSSQINKLVQGLTELGSKIGELTLGPVIQNLLTGANKLLDILNKVFDPEEGNKLIQLFFKGIGAFIAGPGLVLVSAAFFKLFQVVSKFAAQGVRDLFKIGSEQERIKNIEGGIVALLQQDAKLRATLLSTSSTQAQKEQAVINAIRQQNALLTQQQALVNSIAASAARAGVGGFTPTGGFTNRRGRGRFAAAGYSGNVSPEEAAMEMSAASQHGYKAGKVRKERIFDGTGSSFMGILNGAETRKDFTNASGYKSTLITPPNGFAASGFIPNFANGAARPRGSSSYSSKNIIRERIEDFPDRELRTALLTANRPATGYKASLLINGKPKDFTKEEIEDAIANKGKARFIKKQEDENRVGSSEKPLLVKAKDYALLIPNLNKKYESQRVFEPGGSGSIDQWQKVKNLNYKLTPTQLAGPQTDPANLTENEEASIAKEAMDNIIKTALSYSEKLSNPLMRGEISPQTIKTRLSQKGGNKGAYGAVQGAAGAAFEAVISQGLGIDGNDAQKLEGGDWDVPLGSVSNNLKELFAIKKPVKAADFKVSTSPSSLESYAKKILNDDKVGYKNKLGVEDDDDDKPKKTRATGRGRGRASGFIPNFAALNDAISREMEAGIPRDKIYIDQDDSLKSPFNEQGLLVANPYDEPKGGKQGIKRAKREGKNPKTYGKAKYAKGFIPNYALTVGAGVASRVLPRLVPFLSKFADDLLKFGSKSSKAGKEVAKLGDAAKKTTFGGKVKEYGGKVKEYAKGEAKNTISTLPSTALSVGLFSLIPQIDFSGEALKKTIVELGSDGSGLSDAMKEEIALRQSFINDLEKEKSKDKPNESRVKDLEGLIKGSEEYSASLENDPLKTEKSALLFIEEATGLVSFLNGIGAFSNKDLENAGPRGEELAGESTLRKILQPFLKLSLGEPATDLFYKKVGSRFEDSGLGGKYYSAGSWTDEEDIGKSYKDKTQNMRDNDAIGEFRDRGYSFSKTMSELALFDSKDNEGGKSNFLRNLFEDKEQDLKSTRYRTSNELVNARANLYEASPENKEGARKEVDRLTSKLSKLDSQIESLDWKSFFKNFEKGVKASQEGESPLRKALRGGKGLGAREYVEAQESNIEYLEQQLRVKLEAAEVRKEIDRVKDLFEQETFSFKFDVKNVRSQLERIIDDVAIGGRKTSVERAGNITELQKKVLRSSEDEFKSNPTVTSAERLGYAGFVNDESSRLDNLQFKRRDELIGQTSSDKFGDLFTQLSGNLNTSGSGSLLLEKEKATAALANAKTAAAGSPDNEDAQQRVEQLTSSLSEIDSKIASRRDTAADPTLDGEAQRIKLKKVQDATKALTIGDLDEGSQKKALEDVFTNLEGLNLGDGGEGIKEEILEAAKEVSAERTKLFVDQEKARLNNELESLEKQKAILDEFVSKFNASFRENIKGTRNTFNTITKNQTPVAQNAAALSAARIGTGESSDAQIISDRLNASNRVTEVFDDANFSGMVGAEDLATFRSNTTSQIVSGEKLTALEDINEIAAKNLRESVNAEGAFGDEQKSAITQVGRSALLGEGGKGIASDIANEAAKSGDTELAARAQELQDVLADPEAGISEILQAVESLNIDESKLSEEVQTALQENIARALGTIGGIKSSVEGAATVDQSQDVSEKIRNFSASLTSLIDGIDSNIPEVKFPEIVAKLEQNTDLLQAAIGGLTTQFTNLDAVSRGLEGSLEIFKGTVDKFKESEDAQTGQNTDALEAMRKALEAVEDATKRLKPDNTKPT